MSDDKRIGRQFPTQSVVLPYTETKGGEAVLFYDQSSRKAMDWQKAMIYDIMAVDDEGLWVHIKFGWSIPRRNGKSELLIMRGDWGLKHGEAVLYTAHLTLTANSTFLKFLHMLTEQGFVENDDYHVNRSKGQQSIEWLKGGGGYINFRTRTGTGGLGEGYDTHLVDEAQEYTSDQETALQYVVSDSANPQTLMCGTPPTAVSKGTVFLNYRKDVLTGNSQDCGWAEWGVKKMSNVEDVDLWYLCNPSLGLILKERSVRGENRKDEVDYNIQRLGLWLSYNQKSAISRDEWRAVLAEHAELPDKPSVFMGVKFAKGTSNVSLAAAVRLSDGRIFVEAIDCRPTREGNSWMMPYLKNPHVREIVIDGANGQTILADEMKDAGVKKKPILPKVAEIIEANSMFETAVLSGTLCHSDQPSLEQIAANVEHRAIGNNGGFGYVSILEGADVSLLDAVLLAHWICATTKVEKKKQRVSC